MKIIINENQFGILEMYTNTNQFSQSIDRVLRPLEKLKKCLFTPDGKYVVYEGKAYNVTNGKEVPINEEWTLSDILHTGADVLSMGLDFVIPGSGAVVDVLNALSYIIEAQFKTAAEKDSLYLMAAITFAFVVLPGPLQAIATPLKRAVKTGVGFASKGVVKGLKIIGGILDTLLLKLPSKINEALKSTLAKNILGTYAGKISGFFNAFSTRIKSILGKLTGKTGKEGAEKSIKQLSDVNFVKSNQFGMPPGSKADVDPNSSLVRSYFVENAMKLLSPKIKGLPKTFNPSNLKILKKSNVGGREVIEVTMENGQNLVWYKSTGSNEATTGKKVGEWFAIPGFGPDPAKPFFVKSDNTVALFKGGNKYLTDMSQFLEKNGAAGLGKTASKTTSKTVGKTSLTKVAKEAAENFFKRIPKISQGKLVLRKMGFATGKPYRYVVEKTGKATTATIKEITDNQVKVAFKNGHVIMVPIETFMKNAVGALWGRRGYSVVVPFFIKRFSDMVLNGDIDYAKLAKLPDLNPDETSKESLAFLEEEVASYEGDTGKYNVNNKAKTVQQSLMKLGYPLPRFKDDGKFGPETLGALKKFQQDNGLTSSVGKLNRLTAKKLSELLKSKNIVGSEELQSTLNSM